MHEYIRPNIYSSTIHPGVCIYIYSNTGVFINRMLNKIYVFIRSSITFTQTHARKPEPMRF